MRALFRTLALVAMMSWLAGCVTMPTRQVATVAQAEPEAIVQARALAEADARGNRGRIEGLLASLDDDTLRRTTQAVSPGDVLYPALARAMLRRGMTPPYALAPDHAWDFSDRAPAAADGYRPPRKLAVLLPLSGNLATAAKPVRDGLLAAYYAEGRARPDIRFHDSSAGAVAAYQRAVAEGADYVIGPLDRNQVGTLFARGELPVPVLALNRARNDPPAGSLSFSLAPEDEGIAAADHLADRRHARVLVLLGSGDDTLRRSADAFRVRLQDRGGQVLATLPVAADAAGLAAAIEGALAGGRPDAIYLAMRGEHARAAMPVLASAGLQGVMKIATSHLGTGLGDPAQDGVLDGVVYPGEAANVRGIPRDAGALTPTARGGAARLFAFGHDAWLIAAYLEHMAGLRGEGGLQGATGLLRLDGHGNVERLPVWWVLRGGVPVPFGAH